MGDAGRGAVVDVQAHIQRLEGEGSLLARVGRCEDRAAPWAGDGVQVDRVREGAGGLVLQVQFDRVPQADAKHRARDRAIEGEVAERRPVRQLALDFLGGQIDAHVRGTTRTDRLGEIGRVVDDRDAGGNLRSRLADDQFAEHARLPVPGDGAVVDEFALLVDTEGDRLDLPLKVDRAGGDLQLVNRQVVHHAVTVDQRDLDHVTRLHLKDRVDLLVDRSADADEDQGVGPSARDEREFHGRGEGGGRRGGGGGRQGWRRRCGGGLGCSATGGEQQRGACQDEHRPGRVRRHRCLLRMVSECDLPRTDGGGRPTGRGSLAGSRHARRGPDEAYRIG